MTVPFSIRQRPSILRNEQSYRPENKVRDVPRLKHTLGMSLRQISEATGVGKTVVDEYVRLDRWSGSARYTRST